MNPSTFDIFIKLGLPLVGLLFATATAAKTNAPGVKLFLKILAGFLALIALAALIWIGWLNWLLYRSSWTVLALAGFWVSGPLLTILVIVLVRGGDADAEASYLLYTSDIIEEVHWHWHYPDIDNSLRPFCAKAECQGELQYHVTMRGSGSTLSCDACGFRRFVAPRPRDFQAMIAREIRRRIRTGQYKPSLPAELTAE